MTSNVSHIDSFKHFIFLAQKECFTCKNTECIIGLVSPNSDMEALTMTCCMLMLEAERLKHIFFHSSVPCKLHVYRLGRVCSHAAAVCFAIDFWTQEALEEEAPTDLPCKWVKPTLKKVHIIMPVRL